MDYINNNTELETLNEKAFDVVLKYHNDMINSKNTIKLRDSLNI